MTAAAPPNDPDSEGRHSVQVVARETGLNPDTLRAWERRYGVVVPSRSEGRQRLYTDAEVERLRLLADLVRGGRRIKDVSSLDAEALEALAVRDASRPVAHPPAAPVDSCLRAISSLDGHALEAALSRAASGVGAVAFVEGLVPAVLREIGVRWEHGAFTVAHEHLATVHVRDRLVELLAQQQPAPGATVLVVTTPSGERHELGALSAAIVAASAGWRPVFLGASVPASDIAAAARQLGASAVALSILCPEPDADIDGELRRLTSALEPGVPLLVGGAGALARREAIESVGARVLEDFAGLRRELAAAPSARRRK